MSMILLFNLTEFILKIHGIGCSFFCLKLDNKESFFLLRFKDGSFASAYKPLTGDVLKAPSANRRPWLWIESNFQRYDCRAEP